MSTLRNDSKGFTLIELMLAMALFITVLILSTVGFIEMNRTFSRGLVRKQLSESVQRTTEEVTRAVRASPVNTLPGNCQTSGQTDCPADGWKALCFISVRFLWKTDAEPYGLYTDNKGCQDGVDTSSANQIMGSRYKVSDLQVGDLVDDLYRVSGVFRTSDDEAIVDLADPSIMRCKGTSQSPLVRSCAVERFNFIVNARGGTSQ